MIKIKIHNVNIIKITCKVMFILLFPRRGGVHRFHQILKWVTLKLLRTTALERQKLSTNSLDPYPTGKEREEGFSSVVPRNRITTNPFKFGNSEHKNKSNCGRYSSVIRNGEEEVFLLEATSSSWWPECNHSF